MGSPPWAVVLGNVQNWHKLAWYPPFFVQSSINHIFPPSGQGYILSVFAPIFDCLEREHQTIAKLVSCPFICLHVPVCLVSLFYCQSVRALFRPSLFHSCDFEPWLKFTSSSQYLEFLPRLMDFKAVHRSWSLTDRRYWSRRVASCIASKQRPDLVTDNQSSTTFVLHHEVQLLKIRQDHESAKSLSGLPRATTVRMLTTGKDSHRSVLVQTLEVPLLKFFIIYVFIRSLSFIFIYFSFRVHFPCFNNSP